MPVQEGAHITSPLADTSIQQLRAELAEVKARDDPPGLFRLNENVAATAS